MYYIYIYIYIYTYVYMCVYVYIYNDIQFYSIIIGLELINTLKKKTRTLKWFGKLLNYKCYKG